MAVNIQIEKHAIAGLSKVKADKCGHVYNVTLGSDTDNGNIIKRGAWLSFDNYAEAEATTFDGVIRQKTANGNWYVEVLSNDEENLLVYSVPMIAEEYSEKYKNEANFYNAQGDVARAYELVAGDIFEVSALGFEGEPEEGATISAISEKKLVVGSAPTH